MTHRYLGSIDTIAMYEVEVVIWEDCFGIADYELKPGIYDAADSRLISQEITERQARLYLLRS